MSMTLQKRSLRAPLWLQMVTLLVTMQIFAPGLVN